MDKNRVGMGMFRFDHPLHLISQYMDLVYRKGGVGCYAAIHWPRKAYLEVRHPPLIPFISKISLPIPFQTSGSRLASRSASREVRIVLSPDFRINIDTKRITQPST